MTPPGSSLSLLLARIDGTQVGFPAAAVQEIVHAVAIAPLPGAPAIIEGAINFHGLIVPVIDVRHRLSLPESPLAPEQFFIILTAAERTIAVRVDDVDDVSDLPGGSLESPGNVSPALQGLSGVAAVEGGAVVIYDVSAFLTQAECDALDRAGAATG